MVQGKSMMPTLKPGDGCVVNCWLPRFRGYHRGDIVVIRDPVKAELMAKRIIGLAGDRCNCAADVFMSTANFRRSLIWTRALRLTRVSFGNG